MKVFTYQISQWRKVKEKNILALDTTVKTGVKAFSPTWEMVMGHKSGHLSDLTYTVLYRRRMKKSKIYYEKAWDKLMGLEQVAIGCYCTPGMFCHRHLLVDMIEEMAIEMGIEFERGGEIT